MSQREKTIWVYQSRRICDRSPVTTLNIDLFENNERLIEFGWIKKLQHHWNST